MTPPFFFCTSIAVAGINRLLGERTCSSREGKESSVSELRGDGDKQGLYPQRDGAFSRAERARIFEERASSEPAVLGVIYSWIVIPPNEYALTKFGSLGAQGTR